MKNEYEIRGNDVFIILRMKGNIVKTVIELKDLEKVMEYKYTWFPSWNESTQSYYVTGYSPLKKVSLHRYLLDDPENLVVDHFDHDTLNNRRNNLRAVDRSVNGQNRKGAAKNSTSKVRGVHWNSEKEMWQTRITRNKKKIFLGYFNEIWAAAQAIDEYRRKQA